MNPASLPLLTRPINMRHTTVVGVECWETLQSASRPFSISCSAPALNLKLPINEDLCQCVALSLSLLEVRLVSRPKTSFGSHDRFMYIAPYRLGDIAFPAGGESPFEQSYKHSPSPTACTHNIIQPVIEMEC
jgi:hypothetical protein